MTNPTASAAPAATIYDARTIAQGIADQTLPALETLEDVVAFLSDVVSDHVMIELVSAGQRPDAAAFEAAFDRTFPVAWDLLLARLDRVRPAIAQRIRAAVLAASA